MGAHLSAPHFDAYLIPDREAARLASILRAHLHRMRIAGKWGPRAIRLGRKVLFRREEIVAWINAGCPDATIWDALQAQNERRARGGRP